MEIAFNVLYVYVKKVAMGGSYKSQTGRWSRSAAARRLSGRTI